MYTLTPLLNSVKCSYGEPGQGQYHIQTDEGPERYFRFQTDNGQFRKEKRLQDGTVIGTEAWIDAAGFLRQKDYIADSKGYRILKSKTIFVGHGRQIEDAIKATKKLPAQSGILVNGNNGINTISNNVLPPGEVKAEKKYFYQTTTNDANSYSTPASTAVPGKLNYLSPAEAAKLEPTNYLGFDHYPHELSPSVKYETEKQPTVHIHPNSQPIEDTLNSLNSVEYPHLGSVSTTTERPTAAALPIPALPSVLIEPPLPINTQHQRIRPIAIASTTPAPIAAHDSDYGNNAYSYSTPRPFMRISTTAKPTNDGYQYSPNSSPKYINYNNYPTSTARPFSSYAIPIDANNLDGGLLPPIDPAHQRRRLRPQSMSYAAPQTLEYDGVSTTQNGFRYILPHQYHEEERFDSGRKQAGSFGYVDPFGIRRVVYYNASPERGFVHRNNNQYVGLGGTPYDPPLGTINYE
ncbi:uncharacterized protein LOC119677639 [Teleopsis dalmanni]|uniref:uncharacterized protein LOC119677639 n=1 Tax=Teleopsis dalmanni TaxID=139649 RepID=UPI0018CFB328|nr:uncharacterized protein LOC119677639 [Teleopsis dalmanni]